MKHTDEMMEHSAGLLLNDLGWCNKGLMQGETELELLRFDLHPIPE